MAITLPGGMSLPKELAAGDRIELTVQVGAGNVFMLSAIDEIENEAVQQGEVEVEVKGFVVTSSASQIVVNSNGRLFTFAAPSGMTLPVLDGHPCRGPRPGTQRHDHGPAAAHRRQRRRRRRIRRRRPRRRRRWPLTGAAQTDDAGSPKCQARQVFSSKGGRMSRSLVARAAQQRLTAAASAVAAFGAMSTRVRSGPAFENRASGVPRLLRRSQGHVPEHRRVEQDRREGDAKSTNSASHRQGIKGLPEIYLVEGRAATGTTRGLRVGAG